MEYSLQALRGMGPQRIKAFEAAGIASVRQLLCHFPTDYRDLTQVTALCDLRPGTVAVVRARITGTVRSHYVRRMHITKAFLTDDTDVINVVWFNQPWLGKSLYDGRELLLYGRVTKNAAGPLLSCPSIEKEAGILPVYPAIPEIPPRSLRDFMLQALALVGADWEDDLPEGLRRRHDLCSLAEAVAGAHRPRSMEEAVRARRRIAFESLLCYQVDIARLRAQSSEGVRIPCTPAQQADFWDGLPYAPTSAQRRVLGDVARDLADNRAMSRMIQGDVGCGKTAVAFGAIALAVAGGFQAALMAPTEVLARQHLESARALLEPRGVRCGLLTGSLGAKERREALRHIEEGDWDAVIGTHALISEDVRYRNLGLVVTDEQHRFGVRQRSLLSRKADAPNVLVMSATPIPRTLALILYGDLDLSVIDELPPGRTPVVTRIVPEEKRAGMYGFLLREVAAGRQVYIVCPLVEESEAVDARPAEDLYEELRTGPLRSVRVSLAHGKMKPRELEKALTDFAAGNSDVLVATTVIEVGVNVPNASVMVIENAERFGLAQLHQLRGRVGRGAAKSWCFLMGESNQRLRTLVATNDGFVIAEKDLELRGAGDIFGLRQSGAAMPGIAGLALSAELIRETHEEARRLLASPDSPETQAVLRLAQNRGRAGLEDVALN